MDSTFLKWKEPECVWETVTAFVGDSTFIREIAEMFEEDFRNSREVRSEEISDKPYWFKLAVRLARLAAPLQ